MKALKLREIDFVFEIPVADGNEWHIVTVQAGLLDGQLNLTFSIGGESQITLPEALIDGVRRALDYARKNTRVQDLREKDAPESDE